MTRYELVFISFGGLIESSSPNILDWAESEMRKRFSPYVYRSFNRLGLMSDSKKFDDRADREFRKATEGLTNVIWYLLAELLHQGWEPFSSADGFATIALRWQYEN